MAQAKLTRKLVEKERLVARGRQDQGVGSGKDNFCSVKSSICAWSEEERAVDR